MTTIEKIEELIHHTSKENEKSFQEIRRHLDEAAKNIARVTDSVGRFAEGAVMPSVLRLFKGRGIQLDEVHARVAPLTRNGMNMELDVVGLGPKATLVIEVKLRLRLDDVKDFLDVLPKVFKYLPSLRRPILYGGVAGMSIDRGVDRFAYQHGLFVIGRTGDNLRILNDRKFKPRSFRTADGNGKN